MTALCSGPGASCASSAGEAGPTQAPCPGLVEPSPVHVAGNGAPEEVVAEFYQPLFRFAVSLTRSEPDASDLVQQTFYTWYTKGSQLRDGAKARAWLFTTLYRVHLQHLRRGVRFPHHALEAVDSELPPVLPERPLAIDSEELLEALRKIDVDFRAPLVLFYLEDYSYLEIAGILGIPLGTVKSRISRGIVQLQKLLLPPPQPPRPITSLKTAAARRPTDRGEREN